MDYWCYKISCDPEHSEILMALFHHHNFEATEELDGGFNAFISLTDHDTLRLEEISALQAQFPFTYQKEVIKDRNWNAEWEASFQPITVGSDVRVRASFHPVDTNYTYDIIINPEMAFGTGHHATTRLMMGELLNYDLTDAVIFDFGTGTGLLAILAEKLGASYIFGNDNDPKAIKNAQENAAINGSQKIDFKHTLIDNVPAKNYNFIFANINRHVIVESITQLYNILADEGHIFISGILIEDKELIRSCALNAGFKLKSIQEEDKWLLFSLYKQS